MKSINLYQTIVILKKYSKLNLVRLGFSNIKFYFNF